MLESEFLGLACELRRDLSRFLKKEEREREKYWEREKRREEGRRGKGAHILAQSCLPAGKTLLGTRNANVLWFCPLRRFKETRHPQS